MGSSHLSPSPIDCLTSGTARTDRSRGTLPGVTTSVRPVAGRLRCGGLWGRKDGDAKGPPSRGDHPNSGAATMDTTMGPRRAREIESSCAVRCEEGKQDRKTCKECSPPKGHTRKLALRRTSDSGHTIKMRLPLTATHTSCIKSSTNRVKGGIVVGGAWASTIILLFHPYAILTVVPRTTRRTALPLGGLAAHRAPTKRRLRLSLRRGPARSNGPGPHGRTRAGQMTGAQWGPRGGRQQGSTVQQGRQGSQGRHGASGGKRVRDRSPPWASGGGGCRWCRQGRVDRKQTRAAERGYRIVREQAVRWPAGVHKTEETWFQGHQAQPHTDAHAHTPSVCPPPL